MASQNTYQYVRQYFPSAFKFTFVLSLSCFIQSVLADETATTSDLEEVVVTAAKRDQSIKDFSGSISVVKTDSLNPGASLNDIANQVPGLSVIDSGPRSINSIVIRGLRMDPVNSKDFNGDGSLVASYVDNIPLQGFFTPPSFSLKDLQQIEVLRGPQGTLYGNASIGGLIRYITAKPDLTKNTVSLTTSVSQTAESHGLNYDADIVANTPLIADELGTRILLAKKENQGFIDNNYLLTGPKKDINSDKADQIRASVLWKPTSEFSLSSSYDYQEIDADDRQASNEEFTGDKYGASSRYKQPMQGILRLASVDATYQLDWASVTASVNRYNYITHTRADQTDYLLTLDKTYDLNYYVADNNFSAFTKGDIRVIKDSAELRFVSPDDQPLRWLAGIFASNDDLNVMVGDHVPGFAATFGEDRPEDLDYLATQKETLREQSLYTEIAYDIQPDWEVAVGGRHYRYKDNADVCSLLFPTSTPYEGNNYPLDCLSGDNVQTGSLGKFSSKYKISNDQSVYFSVAQGLRRGGTNFLPVEVQTNRSYKADTNLNYEVGTHSNFLNETIQVNAAIFYMYWKDVQIGTYNDDGYAIISNAGDARSKGFEIETILQLMQDLSARISYSYTHAEISESKSNIDGNGSNVYVGDRLPGSPQDQVNVGLRYSHVVDTATWDAGINYTYNGNSFTAPNNSFVDYSELDGYSTINANAGISLNDWHIGTYVNNLANTRAITNRRTPRLYGEQGQFEYITRPRTIGVSLNYQF